MTTSGLHTVGTLVLRFGQGSEFKSGEVPLSLKDGLTEDERQAILARTGELIHGYGKGDEEYRPVLKPGLFLHDPFQRPIG
jgi:hypothetical protein